MLRARDRQRSKVNLGHRLAFADTLLEAGGQYVHWHSPTGELYFVGREREEETLGGYVNAEQKLFDGVLTLDASGRVDKHTVIKGIELYDESATGSMNCSGGMGMGGGGMGGMATAPCKGHLRPRAAAGQKHQPRRDCRADALTRELSASGRYSHTRQGALSEIISVTGQPLDGESQDKWEAAVTASYVPWLMPTLTYFDTRIANDKVPDSYVAGMGGTYVAQWREADTHRAGFELIAKGTVVGVGLPGKLTYSAGWTHLTTLDGTTSPTNAALDAAYPHTKPRDLVNATVTEELGPYFSTVSWSHVSSYLSNFMSMGGVYNNVGDFDVIDANIGQHFMVGAWDSTFTFYGRNLLDQHYETYNGYPVIGRVIGAEFVFKY